MTYSVGNLIVATDYNGFANDTSGGNVNYVWGTGSGDYGYGQSTTLATVSANASITATQWSSLNTRVSSLGSQTNTSIAARTNPTTGTLISILTSLGTNITSCVTNRGNAQLSGTTSSTWSGNSAKTSDTGTGNTAWTITWSFTITWPSANAARYFWNAGGLIRLDMSKTSGATGGFDSDPDWNAFIATMGTFYVSGAVSPGTQTIAGTSYTGFTRIGGTGSGPLGWYALTPGVTFQNVFTLQNPTSPYNGDAVSIFLNRNTASTALNIRVQWISVARLDPGQNTQISGGSDTASPFTSFGTAPAVICRSIPPSTTYLTDTWSPVGITASVT